MPVLERPDEVEIHWEERGEGPLVLLLPHAMAPPAVYNALNEELARDHRVVTYDPRGTGRSTRNAEFSIEADVDDLTALLRQFGDGAVCAGWGDGFDRGLRVAAATPELVSAAVACGATALGPVAISETESLAGSQAVIDALLSLGDRSPRAALRSMLEVSNPGIGANELQERLDGIVTYASPDALQFRLYWFRAMDVVELGRALGPRLWIAHWASPWVPEHVQQRIRELVPDAHVEPLEEGPISRPDLTAAVVRKAGGG